MGPTHSFRGVGNEAGAWRAGWERSWCAAASPREPGRVPDPGLRCKPGERVSLFGAAPVANPGGRGRRGGVEGIRAAGANYHLRPHPGQGTPCGQSGTWGVGSGTRSWHLPRGRSANNFTSHFQLGDSNAHSRAQGSSFHFYRPEHESRGQLAVLTQRPLSGWVFSKNDGASTISLLQYMQRNLRLFGRECDLESVSEALCPC